MLKQNSRRTEPLQPRTVQHPDRRAAWRPNSGYRGPCKSLSHARVTAYRKACPVRVKAGPDGPETPRPGCPKERTWSIWPGMSDNYQQRHQSGVNAGLREPAFPAASGLMRTVALIGQARASNTILNGVSAARRNLLKPASFATFFNLPSPACAPSPRPTSWVSEAGVQMRSRRDRCARLGSDCPSDRRARTARRSSTCRPRLAPP